MPDRPVPGTFCWFECASTDTSKAREFYNELFGWETVDVPMPGEMSGNYTLFQIDGDDVAGLFPLSGPMFEGVPSHWGTYVATDDVNGQCERARSLGAKILFEPMDVPGVARLAGFADPTGAVISLFDARGHQGSAHFGDILGSFCWSELATRDSEKAEKFYSQLFPWELKPAQAPGMKYTEFQVGGRPIGGIMEMTPQHGDAPPHWLPYVTVGDCDSTAARVSELGGRVIVPPRDIPGTGRFTVFQDPTSAFLAAIHLQIQS